MAGQGAFWSRFAERAARHDRYSLVATARASGLWPYFREVQSAPGPVVAMDGRERLMFGSNNYLGLTTDARVKASARAALDAYGSALTGSRLLNGTTPLHRELESEIAGWMGCEDALVFTTGYQANLGCLSAILTSRDTVICDSADHASIFDGAALSGAEVRPFRHGRLDKLEEALGRAGAGALVVVDGVFSMEGDVCDLPRVAALCRTHEAALMVDEAHAVGVLGERGAGASELLAVEDEVDIRTGTFSKSLASCGGFVAGAAEAIDFMRVDSRSLLFSAAAVPAALGAALAAVRICRSEEGRELFARVLENARYLRAGVADLGFDVIPCGSGPNGRELLTPIIAVVVGDNVRACALWKLLYDAGLYTNVAMYPAVPRGRAALRISLMATHEREHLDRGLETMRAVREEAEAGFFTPA
jgi:8-amino-7-oxononanoate synthase